MTVKPKREPKPSFREVRLLLTVSAPACMETSDIAALLAAVISVSKAEAQEDHDDALLEGDEPSEGSRLRDKLLLLTLLDIDVFLPPRPGRD